MLSNLETDKQKLIQIVLVGQPQLREKLDRPSLRQLQQRIGVRYHILPLDAEEIRTYIEHRLDVAGSDGSLAFTEEAFEEIYRCSAGIPRPINLMCDRALLACYVMRVKLIDRALIQRSYQELMGQLSLSTSEPVKV